MVDRVLKYEAQCQKFEAGLSQEDMFGIFLYNKISFSFNLVNGNKTNKIQSPKIN